ncbi:winged helix-turn-helix transcriptional regulator [Dactylosporangium sp. CS-033363]|uniref:winged helix-turn-helix transcriptional regulator n=1 Tax=unclassified Dactylosporangium TaxID=2621675 RepID=UPI003D8B6147
MARKTYGQYCGVARAMELLGERWTMLIVRDLLVAAKRYTDLHRGLPGIPTNVLADRLKELEAAGVVERVVMPRPDGSVVYRLSPYGEELNDVVLSLGRWGAKALGEPLDTDIVTADSLIMAIRTTYHPAEARGLKARYEVQFGDILVHAIVDRTGLQTGTGGVDRPDLRISAGPALRAMMAGELDPDDAVREGSVTIDGDIALLHRFADVFRIEPMPVAEPA